MTELVKDDGYHVAFHDRTPEDAFWSNLIGYCVELYVEGPNPQEPLVARVMAVRGHGVEVALWTDERGVPGNERSVVKLGTIRKVLVY